MNLRDGCYCNELESWELETTNFMSVLRFGELICKLKNDQKVKKIIEPPLWIRASLRLKVDLQGMITYQDNLSSKMDRGIVAAPGGQQLYSLA